MCYKCKDEFVYHSSPKLYEISYRGKAWDIKSFYKTDLTEGKRLYSLHPS